MAKLVLHHSKLGKGKVSAAGAHNMRLIDGNPDIDRERTKLNEDFIRSELAVHERIKNKILDAGITKTRRDAVMAEELIVSASPDFFKDKTPEESKAFLKCAVDWAQEKYKDNLVSAIVHMDETTPHLHMMIVPLVEKEDGKHLTAKELFTPKECARNQEDLAAWLNAHQQLVERGAAGSKAKHKDGKQYKAEELNRLQKELEAQQTLAETLTHDIARLENKLAGNEKWFDRYMDMVRDRDKEIATLKGSLETAQEKITTLEQGIVDRDKKVGALKEAFSTLTDSYIELSKLKNTSPKISQHTFEKPKGIDRDF